MKREEKAVDYFRNGFNCAQSVFASFNDLTELDEKDLLKISSGFGAGMGRLQNTCGAVTGAYLAISLKYGKTEKDDNNAQDKTYQLVRVFDEEFKKIYNTTGCRDLLGCSLLTEEGRKIYHDNNLREKVCEKCVKDAVEILIRIIL